MKREIRIVGIDDAPFDKFSDKETQLIATVFRGGEFMDGLLSCDVRIDGDDATEMIAGMINSSKFKAQIRAIMLDGIAVAGFNIIDIKKLFQDTGIPVIVVMRDHPDMDRIKSALTKLGMGHKLLIIEKAGVIHAYKKLKYQCVGLDQADAEIIFDLTVRHALIPEPLRLAHIIASGVKDGESRGRA